MNGNKRGLDLLQDPALNKSTGFSEAEKQAYGLVGLVPDAVESIDIQMQRVLLQLSKAPNDLAQYIYLMNLLDHDEVLFYKTVMSDPARFLPIVYDPTIGEACLKFGHIFRQTRGLYLSIARRCSRDHRIQHLLRRGGNSLVGEHESLFVGLGRLVHPG